MIVARIKVYDACALTEWANPITAGMVGAQVRIDYASEAWDGLTKTVVFSGAVTKDITTDDTIVDIPAECMAMAGVMLKVGVFGFRAADKKVVIPTVEANIGRLLRGTDPSGDESTNPALPVWAEILETAKRAESISGTSAQEALIAAERALSAKDAASASEVYAAQAAKSAEDSAAAASGAAASADQAKESAAQSADAAKTAVDGIQKDLSKVKEDLDDLDSAVFGETIETDVTGEVLNGVIIDTRTGNESTKFKYSKCTGFIDVSDNANYYYTGKIYNYIGIAGYNSNGEFIASVLSDLNENFTDYKLTIPDRVSKIRASSYSPSETVTNPLQVVKKVKTSNLLDEVSALNDEVSALNEIKENIARINHIYVATTGSDTSGDGTSVNPFATIYHANEVIADATEINQYIIHVADGIYTDLQTRYAGIQTHENYEGIKCKPWVIYEGNVKHPENVVIQWDGKTGYGDEFNYKDHAVHFCPFHITGSNGWTVGHKEIRGFTFDCKNTRYALHVEMSGYGYGVTWKVSDCVFIWHGIPDCSDITYQIPAVGTGSGHYEKGYLLRCKIINDSGVTDGFRNHDSKWVYGSLLGNLPHIGAEIIIEDCVFNAGDSGDTNATFRSTNGNGLVDGYNRFSIINCAGINKLSYQLSGGSTECEWRANIKCSKIVTNQFLDEGLLQ